MIPRKILFVTGTRADYGKVKPLIRAVEEHPVLEAYVYVTGMHLSQLHGSTFNEVKRDGWRNVYIDFSLSMNKISMAHSLACMIQHISAYLMSNPVDMVVVHGDRCEAMAGALAAAIQNVRVAHIEGGEISGTIDESLRHAITKLAHEHFVANEDAAKRVWKLGEPLEHIFTIGSPDIDAMLGALPKIDEVKRHYEIPYDKFSIVMFHPVTTQLTTLLEKTRCLFRALDRSNRNFVVVYPNNDSGHESILSIYDEYRNNPRFRFYPSLRFEFFLSLLKHCDLLIGNSSAGVREAGIYGTPAIDVGVRQLGRYCLEEVPHLRHVLFNEEKILEALRTVERVAPSYHWGTGNAAKQFVEVISQSVFWESSLEKKLPF